MSSSLNLENVIKILANILYFINTVL